MKKVKQAVKSVAKVTTGIVTRVEQATGRISVRQSNGKVITLHYPRSESGELLDTIKVGDKATIRAGRNVRTALAVTKKSARGETKATEVVSLSRVLVSRHAQPTTSIGRSRRMPLPGSPQGQRQRLSRTSRGYSVEIHLAELPGDPTTPPPGPKRGKR